MEIEPNKPDELLYLIAETAQAGYRTAEEKYKPLVLASQVFVDMVDDVGGDWDRVQVWIEREDWEALRDAIRYVIVPRVSGA